MSLLSVPLKTVLPYWADVQNETLPVDWAYCDGRTLNSSQQDVNPGSSYTVPDLRNMSLLGGDLTKAAGTAGAAVGSGNESVAAGAPGPKGTGGENSHTLATAELASHTHVASTGTESATHTHGPNNGVNFITDNAFNATGVQAGPSFTALDAAGLAVATATTTMSASHTHAVTVNNAGSGSAHENRPRYTGVIYIMKVKY